jgi:thiosulfate/3-mercaptopyruvate sulfurtransferase
MNTPLVSVDALRERLASPLPAPLLLDCSFDLADPAAGETAFAQGHLPGALYVHLDRDLSGPKTGTNGRHPLRTRAQYAAWMASLGIDGTRDVVVLDRQAGMFAVRAWWVLRWMGHTGVALLDGGVDAWVRAGGPLTTEVQAPSPVAPSAVPAPAMPTVDAPALLARLDGQRLLDARAPERYRGDVEPLDRVAGHIPGARNRFFKDNLQADGTFKPAAQLRAEYEPLLDGGTAEGAVVSCGSGVTACHDVLAMEVAGLGTATLYPGSWSEWSSDPARPVARG